MWRGRGAAPCASSLRAQKNPLSVFYYRGDLSLVESRGVSVVGAHRPSDRGAPVARRIARALAGGGITVVTGLAAGIDMAAIRKAISAGETSRTRTQAQACIDQGKELVLLPGAVRSVSWAKALPDKGAALASSVTETMDLVG